MSFSGPLLVALGALLWATDAVFRVPTVQRLNPIFIVFAEHAVALAVLLPYMVFKHREQLLAFKAFEWFAALLIGAGGSALASIFFTASFAGGNPSVTILLQKLQPILVILLAYVFLKERPPKNYYGWTALALLSAFVLSFPDLQLKLPATGIDLQSKSVIYALSAAGLWAIATVAGKALLNRTAPSIATFWRYVFGLGALLGLLVTSGTGMDWAVATDPEVARSLVYMGLVPGLLAMVFYYNGLGRTSASVATVMELTFPVAAVAINTYFLGMPLGPTQLVAGAALVLSVTMITAQGQS